MEFTKKVDIIFDITHWLTSENNTLHSTAITSFSLTWIEVVFILLEFQVLRFFISCLTGLSAIMARDISVMPFCVLLMCLLMLLFDISHLFSASLK